MSDKPLVTVVVPARNEEGFIAECLHSIVTQTYANLDIVVIDAMSTDRTVEIVENIAVTDQRVRIVENVKRSTPDGLNVGLAAARGELLVRVDAHATVPPDYVERAVHHLSTGEWGGVGGRKDGIGLTPAGRAIAAAMASRFGVGGSTYHHGKELQPVEHIPFGAYPTDVAREIGGWDVRLPVNQDFEFDWRIRASGRRLLFDPAMRIDWICRQRVLDLWRQYVRYGRGKVRVAVMHPDSLSLRHLMPPLFVLWLIGVAILAPFRPLLGLGLVAPYLAFVAVGCIGAARGLGLRECLHLPGAFVAMHIGWGYGFWRGVFALAGKDGIKRLRNAS